MALKQNINRLNLTDEAYNILANRIVNRKLKPGARLIEDELAEDIGISRTPIREALNRLAQDGLIELIPRKGAQVSRLKARDVEEIYELRKLLEGLATEKATASISKEELNEIRKLMKRSELSSKRRLEYFLKVDLKLHNLIISHCDNSRLIKMIKSLHNFVSSFRVLDAQYARRIKQAHKEHKAILKALFKKDATAARLLIEQHIDNAKKNILSDFELKDRET